MTVIQLRVSAEHHRREGPPRGQGAWQSARLQLPLGLFPLVPVTWHHDLVYREAWPQTRHSPPHEKLGRQP